MHTEDKPRNSAHRRDEDCGSVRHSFFLPYIIQPEGTWRHQYASQTWQIEIRHILVPPLVEIVTGIRFNPDSPVGIQGPQEIFKGVTSVGATELDNPSAGEISSDLSKAEIHGKRNLIAALLNDLQYQYLLVSGKYWWNAVSADHFVSMKTETATRRGVRVVWGGSGRSVLAWRTDDAIPTDF
jgi:hypothetical protein